MKDLQRELDDSRAAQKEVLSSARESERRSKMMEAEILQLHEVLPPASFDHIREITSYLSFLQPEPNFDPNNKDRNIPTLWVADI